MSKLLQISKTELKLRSSSLDSDSIQANIPISSSRSGTVVYGRDLDHNNNRNELSPKTDEHQSLTPRGVGEKKKLPYNTSCRALPRSLEKAKNIFNSSFLEESTIMTRSTHRNLLLEWISEEKDIKGVSTLLYKGSRDGFESSIFHEKCDGKGSTVVIVEANSHIFGGFANPSWELPEIENWKWIDDEKRKSFLFSMDKETKLKIGGIYEKRGEKALCGHKGYGPWFGQSDLRISSFAESRTGSVSQLGSSYSLPQGQKYSSVGSWKFLAGDHSFMITDIEVFQIF